MTRPILALLALALVGCSPPEPPRSVWTVGPRLRVLSGQYLEVHADSTVLPDTLRGRTR